MEQIENLSSLIEDGLSRLEIDRSGGSLYTPISYSLAHGGKRMRPLLCLLAARVFTDRVERALDSALAVEIFHNFTLLHDDIMDCAPTRRGRPTVCRQWGDNRAILSGDAMMILAYRVLCRAVPLGDLLTVFNRAAMEVCEGQQLDMEFENEPCVSMDRYIEMIRLKTASLMGAGMKMGAIAAGADIEQSERLYHFGENLGIAFQIQDDLLDTYGDSMTFGKQIGGDISEGKQTFLRISAMSLCSSTHRASLADCRQYDTIRGIYDFYGVEDIARLAIGDYFSRALSYLDSFGIDRTHLLVRYGELLMLRQH